MKKLMYSTLLPSLMALVLPAWAGALTDTERAECIAAPSPICVMGLAVDTARSIEDVAGRALALADVGAAQAKAGDKEHGERAGAADYAADAKKTVAEALEVARRIPDSFLRARALSAVVEAQLKAKERDAAKRTVIEALDAAYSIEDELLGAQALRAVAEARLLTGDVAGAIDIANGLKETHKLSGAEVDVDWRSRTLRTVSETQADEGDLAGAQETLASIDDDYWRAHALRTVAEKHFHEGNIDAAIEVALRTGGDAGVHAIAYVAKHPPASEDMALAQPYIDQALAAARRIEGPVMRSRAMIAIVKAQVVLKDFAGALETARGIEDAAARAHALGVVSKEEAEAGSAAHAREIVALALEAVAGVDDGFLRAWVLGSIAEAQAAIGDIEDAKGTFNLAVEAAWSIKAASRRTQAVSAIVVFQAESGNIKGALDTAMAIENPAGRVQALRALAQSGGSPNKPEKLKQWTSIY